MDDDGFYMGEIDGVRGLVPSNFLTEAPEQYSAGQTSQTGGGSMGRGQRGRGIGPGARGPPPPPRENQMRQRNKGTLQYFWKWAGGGVLKFFSGLDSQGVSLGTPPEHTWPIRIDLPEYFWVFVGWLYKNQLGWLYIMKDDYTLPWRQYHHTLALSHFFLGLLD